MSHFVFGCNRLYIYIHTVTLSSQIDCVVIITVSHFVFGCNRLYIYHEVVTRTIIMVHTVNAFLLIFTLISAFFISMLYVFCKLMLTNIQNTAQCQGFMCDCKHADRVRGHRPRIRFVYYSHKCKHICTCASVYSIFYTQRV